MTTVTYKATRSSLFAYRERYSYRLAGGRDDHIPSGYHVQAPGDPYRLRGACDWAPIPWADLGVTRIVSATLRLHRTTSNVHLVKASGARIIVEAIAGRWSPNSRRSANDSPAGGGWTSDPTTWTPSGRPTGRVTATVGTSSAPELDITTIVRAWAPATVEGGGRLGQYGVLIRPSTERSTSVNAEFYSAVAGSSVRPELVLVYETSPQNVAPYPPVLGPTMSEDPARLTFTATDPDAGDTLSAYDVQLRALPGAGELDPGWTDPLWDVTGRTDGISGWAVDSEYDGPALQVGDWYEWRARVYDQDDAVSGWSSPAAFVAGAGVWDAYSAWASHVIGALSRPTPDRELGTIYPEGDQVAQLVTTDYRERWRIHATYRDPEVDVSAAVYGLMVDITADGIEAIATLGDVQTSPPPPPPPTPDCVEGTDIASLATATGFGLYFVPADPEHINDDDLETTSFMPNSVIGGDWHDGWSLDFGSARALWELILYIPSTTPGQEGAGSSPWYLDDKSNVWSDLLLWSSDDGSTWTEVAYSWARPDPDDVLSLRPADDAAHRYWRLDYHRWTSEGSIAFSSGFTLHELEMIECVAP